MGKKKLDQNLLDAIDDLIRKGEITKAQSEIDLIAKNAVPRTLLAPLARMARRVGRIDQGLRLLGPVIRPRNRKKTSPSESELLEYSVLLQRNGSLREAWEILSNPLLQNQTETSLYKSFVLFNEWRYQEAIPYLESYLNHPNLSEYSMLVGQVNLFSAVTFLDQETLAERIFKDLSKKLNKETHSRLLLNALEIRASSYIRQHRLDDAMTILQMAQDLHKEHTALDFQYLIKWKLILESYQTKSTEKLYTFKEESKKKGLSEIERDSDFHLIKINFDKDRANYLYAGTPFESYRSLLKSSFPQWVPPTETYQWGKSGNTLNLITSSWKDQQLFKVDSLQHRLLLYLCRDLYSWQSVGAIHSNLFHEDYFDIDSSPRKIHQLVLRVRDLIKSLEIPVEIESGPLGYKIKKMSEQMAILLPIESAGQDQRQMRLKKIFGTSLFKRSEADAVLETSRSSTQRYLEELEEAGLIVSVGSGHGKMYQFKT